MKNLTLSFNSVIAWILKVLMLAAVAYFFLVGNYLLVIFSILALFISLIPVIVNRSYDTNLPWSFDFWLTVWMASSVVGEIGLYDKVWWWDSMLHLCGTMILSYLAFVLVYALNFTKKIKLSIPLIGLFTFLIGVAIGALWEIAEFLVWQITGRDTLAMLGSIENGFYDTFHDLEFDAIGALIIALGGMKYVGDVRNIHLKEWMRPFVKIFGRKIEKVKVKAQEKLREEKKKLGKTLRKTKNKLTSGKK